MSGPSSESGIGRRRPRSLAKRGHSMRSLTFKLVLAFLLTSIAGVALASVFIRQSVTSEFDTYVIAQQRAAFVDDVGEYYATSGSWAGIERWLRDQAAQRLAEAASGSADAR